MKKCCTCLASVMSNRAVGRKLLIRVCLLFLFISCFIVGTQVFKDEDIPDNLSLFHRKLLQVKKPPQPVEHFMSQSNNTSRTHEFQDYYINDEVLKHSLVIGTRRKSKGYLTIGIPTIHRASANYINSTLDSIVAHTSARDKDEVVVVIMTADSDADTRAGTIASLYKGYRQFFESGFFQLIQAPEGVYPSLTELDRTFNDKAKRVEWRSKQNLDYSFMFAYSRNISKYFVMLEDDVASAHDFVTDIKMAVAQQTNTYSEWYCIEFSHLGFIGKLFRSSDLMKTAIFFHLFYRYQPGDMLLPHLYNLNTQFKRIVIKPTLFQHMGFHSSLGNVRGKVEDKFFKTDAKQK